MKTKFISLCFALLIVVSVWADDVWNYNVYEDCSKNGYKGGYIPAPANVQAIDLGLPSGIKWASCNVGADTPEGYGYYYAWGEVVPKEEYSWATYKYANGTSNEDPKLTKYCNDATFGNNGFTDNKMVLDSEDDAAHMNWGGKWRMPTDAEMDELLNNCTWTWTTQNGVKGYQVASDTNGNAIFLPAAGFRRGTDLGDARRLGYYWSSSLNGYYPYDAWGLYFWSGLHSRYCDYRYDGFSVRPVCP